MPTQQEILEAKRQEVLAKLAKMQNQHPGLARPPAAQAAAPQQQPQQPQQQRAPPALSVNRSEIQRKIEEARQRVQQKTARPQPMPALPTTSSGGIDLKAMLDKGIIPKREQQLKASRKPGTVAAGTNKAATASASAASPSTAVSGENPYLAVQSVPGPTPLRKPRALRFVRPGKYVDKANDLRAKTQLERLKEQVAAKVRQAGMETEMDISDKSLKKAAPPAVEWWDAPFLPNKTYDDLPIDPAQLTTLVTSFVHHPVQIQPPNDNQKVASRALMLTKKERKKLRRQRRHEMQKDKQDKIRLGLLPPDPPKVKISNLMKVLGDEAIQDPTKVEARVRKEMEMRQKLHDQANEARKLTPEQRREKIANKQLEDQKNAIEAAVFKIKNCAHPKLKYKIEMNAKQHGLTGIVMVNPKCHMVVVEGGPKAIKSFKKLMLRRIDWNDLPAARNISHMDPEQLQAIQAVAEDKSNQCWIVWHGQIKEKHFKKFTWHSFESERMARQELTKWKAENYWDAALISQAQDLDVRQPVLS